MSALSRFLREHFIGCPYKKNLHMECPGCGFQRSFVELLEGHVVESFHLYPALIPLLSVWILVMLHLIFKFKHGAAIIKYLFLFCAAIIAISYIIKVINGDIFK
jgi:hypothetical protein